MSTATLTASPLTALDRCDADCSAQAYVRVSLPTGSPLLLCGHHFRKNSDALTRIGLTQSNGDARRQIKGGAVRVNDVKVDDDRQVLSMTDLSDGIVKLSVGKKKHALLKAV